MMFSKSVISKNNYGIANGLKDEDDYLQLYCAEVAGKHVSTNDLLIFNNANGQSSKTRIGIIAKRVEISVSTLFIT